MKPHRLTTALVAILLSSAALAGDLCRESCTADRKDCRLIAAQTEAGEKNDLYHKGPRAYLPTDYAATAEAATQRVDEARARRRERDADCEATFRRCTEGCSQR